MQYTKPADTGAEPPVQDAGARPRLQPGRTVLIVEHHVRTQKVLKEMLGKLGYDLTACDDVERGMMIVGRRMVNLILVDYNLNGMTGLEFTRRAKKVDPFVEAIIVFDGASVGEALDALRAGAYDYLLKPFDVMEDVALTIRHAVERQNLNERNSALIRQLKANNSKLTELVSELEVRRTESEMFNKVLETKLSQAEKRERAQSRIIERTSQNLQKLIEDLGRDFDNALNVMHYFASETMLRIPGSDSRVADLSSHMERDMTRLRQRYEQRIEQFFAESMVDDVDAETTVG